MKRTLLSWMPYWVCALFLLGLVGCHMVAGLSDLEPGGGAGGSTASGTGGDTGGTGGTGGTTSGGGGGTGGTGGGGGSTSSGGGGGSFPTYTVGGDVYGLDTQATLDNGHETLDVDGPGPFTFPTPLVDGEGYLVQVVTQPTLETCTVANGTGTIVDQNVTEVIVECLGDNADLSALEISAGALTFNPSTLSYTVTVGALVATMSVTPTAADPDAQIHVNSVLTPSGTSVAALLGLGQSTTISVEVTSESTNNTKTYQVDVIRAGALVTNPAYLKASNTEAFDSFGYTVALSGNTLVVGAGGEDSDGTNQGNNGLDAAGAAFVFVLNGGTWSQQAYLKASNPGQYDQFGHNVAISGDTIVVGVPLEDSSSTGINGVENDNTFIQAGAAYVFVRNGTTWSQQAYLKASDTYPGDRFGHSVAIFGDTIVVGAINENSNATGVNGNQTDDTAADAGAAYVFVRNGTAWSQQAYLKASNTEAGDTFGRAVSIWGDTIVVGAANEDSNATGVNNTEGNNNALESGAGYVFVRNGTNWAQQAYLKASNTGPDDGFGRVVSIFRDSIVVGAWYEDSDTIGVNVSANDNSDNTGAAYVYRRAGTTWAHEAYVKASNTGLGDQFGTAVSMSDEVFVVTAGREDSDATGADGAQNNNSISESGAAYVFTFDGGNWVQMGYVKASNTGMDDHFGNAVALTPDSLIVSTNLEDSNETDLSGTGADNSAEAAGAAYAFQ
ncbi:MAG: cadherin-like beta sandwich domain-containing protein [Deltaproteobacteria bacterium]|nr:cadherin-like beta sandwich domain-containing protein [Deltaproteobacteria bacterium]